MFTLQIFNRRGEQIYSTTEANINRACSYLVAKSYELDLEQPWGGMMESLIKLANRAEANAVTGEGDPVQSFDIDTATDGTKSEKSITVTYNAKFKFTTND